MYWRKVTNEDVVSPINTELSGLGLDVNMEYESMVQDRKTARARIQELEGV